MMVVSDPILESRRRTGRLNAPDEALSDQDVERVIHRLERDGTDLCPDGLGHTVRRNVRLIRHGSQDGQPLGGDLNAALPKEFSRVDGQAVMLDQNN